MRQSVYEEIRYIMYTKIKGIGHFLGESARDPLSIRKRSENVTFGCLSGIDFFS